MFVPDLPLLAGHVRPQLRLRVVISSPLTSTVTSCSVPVNLNGLV